MSPNPNASNIKIWRRVTVWSLIAVIYIEAAIMAWGDLSPAVNWWMFVAGASIGSFVVIYKLHALRENHRSSYAIIEITMAIVVISLAIASGVALLGMKISYVPEVSLIGSVASAIYFGVRAWDNLYQSETGKQSKFGRWMDLWTKERPLLAPEPIRKTVYPWSRGNGREPE